MTGLGPGTVLQLADMGTPIMWLTQCHLLVLNAVIGILEGWILWRWFGASRGRAIGTMIAANYLSAFAGFASIWPMRAVLVDRVFVGSSIYCPLWTCAAIIVLVFAGTVAIEWPFVAIAMRSRSSRRTLVASMVVNAASYTGLLILYLLVSQFSFYTSVRHEDSLGFVDRDRDLWVYYIATDDGGLWRVHPDGSGRERLRALNLTTTRNSTSFFWANDIGALREGSAWNLYARVADGRSLITPQFASVVATNEGEEAEPLFQSPWIAPDMRSPHQARPWSVRVGVFGESGLTVSSETGDPRATLRLALATPWEQWMMRNAAITPGGLVVFQAGMSRVMVLDPERRVMGVLAVGGSPVVARD